jgi:hypothetical protein
MSERNWLGKHSVERRADLPEDRTDMTRRQALITTGMNAASLTLASGIVGRVALDQGKAHAEKKGSQKHKHSETAEVHTNPEWWKEKWYETPPELVGENVNNKFEWGYIAPDPTLNIETVPVVVQSNGREFTRLEEHPVADPTALPARLPPIPFHKNLSKLFEVKEKTVHSQGNAAEQIETYDRLNQSYTELFELQQVRSMDLHGLQTLIQHETHTVASMLREKQDRIAEIYLAPYFPQQIRDNPKERARHIQSYGRYLRFLTEQITPDMMLAYMATELMPAPDRGIAMLEFIAQNGGVEFLERIPSTDPMLSFGPFQLTPYVIGKKGSVTHLLETIHEQKVVPDSLEEFSSIEEHIRAGFLFAFQNLIILVQNAIKHNQYAELQLILEGAAPGKGSEGSSVFLEYLSAAHHRPESAVIAMQKWMGVNKHVSQAKRTKTLHDSFSPAAEDQEVRAYAEKARRSYADLHARAVRSGSSPIGEKV